MRESIDRNADRAVYRQIADALREAAADGELPVGSRLPSEAELIRRFGVAQGTVRAALGVLRAEGVVQAEPGRGVFVAEPRPHPQPRHDVAVTAIILDEGMRALAVRESEGVRWHPPGGAVHPFETIPDAVARHAHTQAGLTVTVENISGLYKDTRNAVLTIALRARPTGHQTPPDETTRTAWLEIPEVRTHMSAIHAGMVHDACTDDPRPRVRAHHGPAPLN